MVGWTRNLWREAVVFGGLWHDLTQLEFVKAGVAATGGGFVVGVLFVYLHSGYSVIPVRNAETYNAVWISPTHIRQHVIHNEVKLPCPGAYAVRKVVRLKADGAAEDVTDIKEHDIGSFGLGHQDFWIDLTPQQPVADPTGLSVTYARYDMCHIIDDIWPTKPMVSPPHPLVRAK